MWFGALSTRPKKPIVLLKTIFVAVEIRGTFVLRPL